MTLWEFAVSNLTRRPARTILTILGVALAIGTAVALLALGRGITDSISRGLDEQGAELVVGPRNATDVTTARLPESVGQELCGSAAWPRCRASSTPSPWSTATTC